MKPPTRSGFCNPANPPKIHASCTKADCPCDCGQGDVHQISEAADISPGASDQTPEGEVPAAGVEPGSSDVEQPRPPVTVENPCVLDDLDEVEYHRDVVPERLGRSLSHSGAKTLLTKSPEHFRWERDHPVYKDVFDFGSAAHKYVLGEGPPITVHEYDTEKVKSPKSTSAWKAQQAEVRKAGGILLLPDEHAQVLAMAAKLREHPIAGRLFVPGNGKAEVSLFWQDDPTGCFLRARIDWLRTTGRPIAVDYKTSVTADPDAFGRRAVDYAYYMQDPWYLAGIQELGLADDPAFVFVVQEKDPPYAVTVIELDEESRRIGRESMRRAIDLYTECQSTDTWPSYADGVASASLPRWFVNQHDERYVS